MKIIDEKGRLFGRINIIDFLIVVIFLVLIPLFFKIYKVMEKTPVAIAPKWVKVEVLTFILPEMRPLLKEGDVSYDEFGNPDGRLLRVVQKDAAYLDRISKSLKSGGVKGERIPLILELKLLCTQSSKGERCYYRREPLMVSIDSAFEFYSGSYMINCFPIKIEE